MTYTLTRKEYRRDGIFSELTDENGTVIAQTLEHAFEQSGGSYAPVIPAGTFDCVRGLHRLHNMTKDFETFEITGIEGHSKLLFHWGNFNADSEGCVLLGMAVAEDPSAGVQMVTNSKATFAQFMSTLSGVDSFTLVVAA